MDQHAIMRRRRKKTSNGLRGKRSCLDRTQGWEGLPLKSGAMKPTKAPEQGSCEAGPASNIACRWVVHTRAPTCSPFFYRSMHIFLVDQIDSHQSLRCWSLRYARPKKTSRKANRIPHFTESIPFSRQNERSQRRPGSQISSDLKQTRLYSPKFIYSAYVLIVSNVINSLSLQFPRPLG